MRSVVSSVWFRLPVAALALIAAGAGQWWLSIHYEATHSLWAWGIAILLFAVLLLDPEARKLPEPEAPLAPHIEWSLLAAVLVVGLFFRFYRLDLIPSGLNHDTAWEGMYAIRILHGEPFTPYVGEAWGRETAMMFIDALSIKLFGVELYALTIPAVVLTFIQLPITYFFARELFGPRIALGSTFLLAVSGWLLVTGRVGWRAVLQPPVSAAACWFFIRGMNTAGIAPFILAGAAAAGALYTYNAARMLPALFFLYALYRLAIAPDRRAFIQRYWRGGVAMAVTFLIVIYPMANYAAHNWVMWQGRATATYFTEGRALWRNIKDTVLLFPYFGNSDDFFVNTPLLEYPSAVLMAFGVVWCLARPSDARGMFLLLGLFVSQFPGFVTKPNANRSGGSIVYVYLFCALGAAFFVRELKRLKTPGRWLAALLLLQLGIGATYATYTQYFGEDRREAFGFYPETTVLGRYMRSILPEYSIWVGGANFPRDTLTYLTYPGSGHPEVRQYTWVDDISTLPLLRFDPAPGKGIAIILGMADRGPLVLDELVRMFPQHDTVDLVDWSRGDRVFARALLIPPGAAALKEPAAPIANPTPPPGVDLWNSRQGVAPGELSDPKGIAIGKKGEIYVADTGNHRIQKYSPAGKLLLAWGARGAVQGRFDEPTAVAVDQDGNVHVVDTWNHRVQKFDPDGKFLAAYTPPKGFFGPRGIAIAKGKVYVTDGGNNLVAVFNTNGQHQASFAGRGSDTGKLSQPVGIAVTPDGAIWVVDSGNNRLQAFTAEGASIRTVDVPGWAGPDIKEGYLAVNKEGALLMTDPIGGQVFRLKGTALEPVATNLQGPCGIATAGKELAVTERGPSRVNKVPGG